MSIFKTTDSAASKFNPAEFTPVIRCSICTGEQVAGFRDRETGKFTEAALLRTPADLEAFREKYGITGEIPKFY